MKQLLQDAHNRTFNYLRISITDRCNLRCQYCAPVKPFTMLAHDDILQYEELLRIVKTGVGFGVNKVRVTGGEPLVRKGVERFLSMLSNVEGLKDVSLTTNGVLLNDKIDDLVSACIKRINISLDSLDRENFKRITGRDHFDAVWRGIQAAIDSGMDPVKINMVVMKGTNDHEILDFARLSLQYPVHVRFIEYMPIGQTVMSSSLQILTPDIRKKVEELGELIPVKRSQSDGPAFRFRLKDALGEIGFISPISRHFCHQCNRLRLTADGKLRPCLLSDKQIDIKTPLRNGISDEGIREIFSAALNQKGKVHGISTVPDYRTDAPMCAIGG